MAPRFVRPTNVFCIKKKDHVAIKAHNALNIDYLLLVYNHVIMLLIITAKQLCDCLILVLLSFLKKKKRSGTKELSVDVIQLEFPRSPGCPSFSFSILGTDMKSKPRSTLNPNTSNTGLSSVNSLSW